MTKCDVPIGWRSERCGGKIDGQLADWSIGVLIRRGLYVKWRSADPVDFIYYLHTTALFPHLCT